MATRDTQKPEQLERRANALFERSVAGLDATTRARLRDGRRRALAELTTPAFTAPRNLGLAAAAVAALVLLVTLPGRQGSMPPAVDVELGTAVATDLELLLGEEDLDMLAELEFYSWLDGQVLGDGAEEAPDGVG